MPSPDALESLLSQLAALSATDRRAVLARLDAAERREVEALLRRAAAAPPPVHSAWFEALLAGNGAERPTVAALEALRGSMRTTAPAAARRPGDRSLVQAMGALLPRAGARP